MAGRGCPGVSGPRAWVAVLMTGLLALVGCKAADPALPKAGAPADTPPRQPDRGY